MNDCFGDYQACFKCACEEMCDVVEECKKEAKEIEQ